MQIKVCDRCGKRIKRIVGLCFRPSLSISIGPNYDLCNNCKEDFDKFMEEKGELLPSVKKMLQIHEFIQSMPTPSYKPKRYKIKIPKPSLPKGITKLMGGKPTTLKEPYTPAKAKRFRGKR